MPQISSYHFSNGAQWAAGEPKEPDFQWVHPKGLCLRGGMGLPQVQQPPLLPCNGFSSEDGSKILRTITLAILPFRH